MAVLAVALVAVLGLATTVAMAATHRPASLRPAADKRTTAPKATVSSAKASARPTSARTTAASAPTVSPGPASVSTVSPAAGTGPSPEPPLIIETVTGTPTTVPSPQSSPSSTASLSAAEQQLANMLNSSILDDCTARPTEESGNVIAAVNCSYTTTGPTLRPLAETLAAGSAESWFQDNTSGFTNSNNCAAGEYVGTWTHDGSVIGQLGCTIESNGLLRIVWLVGNDVGLIAEGSDDQALYSWWKSNACLVPSAC